VSAWARGGPGASGELCAACYDHPVARALVRAGVIGSVLGVYGMDMQAYNRALIEEFRANAGVLSGQLAKSHILLLTTTGARTGLERVTPLGYGMDGERIVVIAANAGAPTHPDWYRNVVARPAVTVEMGGERFAARARTAEGAERDDLVARAGEIVPYFAAQQAKTTREIPFVVIERV
jgi:deazaflavin-dependent oxidoreductase (nitroreductase family)